MSYQAMVKVTGELGYTANGLRFATRAEAEAYAADLYSRWTAVQQTRVDKSADPINYTFHGKLEPAN